MATSGIVTDPVTAMLTDGEGWASCGLVTLISMWYVVLASSTRPGQSERVRVRLPPSPPHLP
eukprot:2360697-Rhodomonas_salina.1